MFGQHAAMMKGEILRRMHVRRPLDEVRIVVSHVIGLVKQLHGTPSGIWILAKAATHAEEDTTLESSMHGGPASNGTQAGRIYASASPESNNNKPLDRTVAFGPRSAHVLKVIRRRLSFL